MTEQVGRNRCDVVQRLRERCRAMVLPSAAVTYCMGTHLAMSCSVSGEPAAPFQADLAAQLRVSAQMLAPGLPSLASSWSTLTQRTATQFAYCMPSAVTATSCSHSVVQCSGEVGCSSTLLLPSCTGSDIGLHNRWCKADTAQRDLTARR